MTEKSYRHIDFVIDLLRSGDPGNPELLFWLWSRGELDDLEGATRRLGLDVPEGDNFVERLMSAVLPKLIELQAKGEFKYE